MASNLAKSEVYFSNENLVIHANKNISNFNSNLKVFEKVIESLSSLNIINFVPYYTGNNKGNNQTEMNFKNWMESDVKLCISHLNEQKDEIKEIIRNALITKNVDERGIQILGEILSSLISVPSPSQFKAEVHIVDEAVKKIEAQDKEIVQIEHIIKDEAQNLDLIENQIQFLADTERQMKSANENLVHYLKYKHKVDNICNQGKKIGNKLEHEATKIHEIKEKNHFFQPSENMFPIDTIFERINEARQAEKIPLFNSYQDLEKVFFHEFSYNIFA